MSCPQCKTALPGDAESCWRCGWVPRRATVTTATPSWTPETGWQVTAEGSSERRRHWPWVVGVTAALALAVVVGTVAWGYFTGDKQVADFEAGGGRVVERPDAGFRVRFPTTPKFVTMSSPSGPVYMLDAQVGKDHEFTVVWKDLAAQSPDLDSFAEANPGEQVLVVEKDIFRGHDARRVLVKKGDIYLRYMVLAAGGRIYAVGGGTRSANDTSEFQTFLNSFELTP